MELTRQHAISINEAKRKRKTVLFQLQFQMCTDGNQGMYIF